MPRRTTHGQAPPNSHILPRRPFTLSLANRTRWRQGRRNHSLRPSLRILPLHPPFTPFTPSLQPPRTPPRSAPAPAPAPFSQAALAPGRRNHLHQLFHALPSHRNHYFHPKHTSNYQAALAPRETRSPSSTLRRTRAPPRSSSSSSRTRSRCESSTRRCEKRVNRV